eukprot:Platyproteum_vivax@DN6509_c0_g1_i1.p1
MSHVESPVKFYLQKADNEALHGVEHELETFDPRCMDIVTKVVNGELLIAKWKADEKWYRAQVTAHERGGFKATFIDYGNEDSVTLDNARKCPPMLQLVPPCARPCALAGVKMFKDTVDQASGYMHQRCTGELLEAELLSVQRGVTQVVLKVGSGDTDKQPTVQEELVTRGLVIADTSGNTPLGLEKQQAIAKKNHFGLWRYGDVGEEEEEAHSAWGPPRR